MQPKVLVTTCDKCLWSIRPFAYLFNIFWSAQQKVDILCETAPQFRLPDNFSILPMPRGRKWPANKWTNRVIQYLKRIEEKHVVILLDDYWLIRTVDVRGISTLCEYMQLHPQVLRMDLTADRLYAGGMQDFDMYGHYDLVRAPGSQYEMSLQAGIWDRELLLTVLQPDWNPWEVELLGTSVVNERNMIVLGTRQNPIRYTNAMKNGSTEINAHGIPREHLNIIERWFNKYD